MWKLGALLSLSGMGLCLISWMLSSGVDPSRRELVGTAELVSERQSESDPIQLDAGRLFWIVAEAQIEGPMEPATKTPESDSPKATWARVPVHLTFRYWLVIDGLAVRYVQQTIDRDLLAAHYAGHEDLPGGRVRINVRCPMDQYTAPGGPPLTIKTLLTTSDRRNKVTVHDASFGIYQQPFASGMAGWSMALMYLGPGLIVVGATICVVGASKPDPGSAGDGPEDSDGALR
jgi:hypothetical protein